MKQSSSQQQQRHSTPMAGALPVPLLQGQPARRKAVNVWPLLSMPVFFFAKVRPSRLRLCSTRDGDRAEHPQDHQYSPSSDPFFSSCQRLASSSQSDCTPLCDRLQARPAVSGKRSCPAARSSTMARDAENLIPRSAVHPSATASYQA